VEGAGVFEQSVAIRGNENFYVDLIANPKLATAIMDKMLEFYIGFWEEMLPIVGPYVQVIKVGDDLGMQNGPLISPDLYRSLIKPRERELISFIKKRTDAKIYFHSCGSVYEFIPDLIEIGVDVLNPIQVSAKDMVTKRLKQEFGERLSFWGAVDTQQVLPFGSQEDVEAEVRKRIGDLAPGGGYILSSVHNIQAKVPPENIAAMFDAAFKYGEYPIQTLP
jgi:uroporphyrinogen decarboxylase